MNEPKRDKNFSPILSKEGRMMQTDSNQIGIELSTKLEWERVVSSHTQSSTFHNADHPTIENPERFKGASVLIAVAHKLGHRSIIS